MTYIQPTAYSKSFTCPHCGAIAQQEWWSITWNGTHSTSPNQEVIRGGSCVHCNGRTLWVSGKMVFPDTGTAPNPNQEMPENVKAIYHEAACILGKSPRAATALLRLAIQMLCIHLGEGGKDLNKDISSLVGKGLPEVVQQSLDAVRVIGNNAVHPGQIDVDDPQTAVSLFDLLNIITEYLIAMPKRVSGIYSNLPSTAIAAIDKRDAT